MDLKTFVKETLTQIAEGVNEAKPIVQNAGCYIIDRVPNSIGSNIPNANGPDNKLHPVSKIDFDVAICIDEEQAAKGGAFLAVASLVGGMNKEKKNSNSVFNHVVFSIYMSVQ